MKERFVQILTNAGLMYWFLTEFGGDWEAEDQYKDGWWFDETSISYRAADLFDDYAEGYNWDFKNGEFWRTILHYILLSHGFEETYNGGDDEDGLYVMEKI